MKANAQPLRKTKERTQLDMLLEQMAALREEVKNEKRILVRERENRKERASVMIVLGSVIEHLGKDNNHTPVRELLDAASWLRPDDRLKIEYYFGFKLRPDAKQKAAGNGSEKDANMEETLE